MIEQVGSFLLGKVRDLLFGVAMQEIGYMWNCEENVKKLKNEVKNLKVLRGKIQQKITIANLNGDKLSYGVKDWVKEADTTISSADKFLEQEANAKIGLCSNWTTFYHYGKGSAEMTPPLVQLQERGVPYENHVFFETLPPRQLDVFQTKNLEDLVTQYSALNDIIAALEDDNIQIIGIHGLGGVGKTTLAKEVAAREKKTNLLFDDVAFTSVSPIVNAEKIQKDLEIARKRIMKGDKILIIIDDVWERLDLEELCIPIDHANCRILLTSRNEDVCEKMNVQCKICVNSLSIDEAWILFKRVVGERVETNADFKRVAKEVVKECGGLPLLIQAVGNALKNKRIDSWESALSRLKKAAPSDIDPDIRKAFAHLKLSYDYLESEEAKSCFLLCSLFPEDDDISLEDLICYGWGLGKFDDPDSIEVARAKVRIAVDVLTSSGLLLNGTYDGCTKMHDIVRDVALLIASQDNNNFLVEAGKGLKEWLPTQNSLERYTGISLAHNRISKLPDYKVNVPHLEIFLVSRNWDLSMISDEFIGCMKKVNVLDVSRTKISWLPQSFQLLTKLRTLNLEHNQFFHDISILGEMTELEILILNETGIKEIPKEIDRLVNLRRLEVCKCKNMTHVAPGVISAFWRLEELCIDLWWMSQGVDGCIAEVMKLSKLTYLNIKVKTLDLIPEGAFNVSSENLKGFRIQIGHSKQGNEVKRSDRCLVISSKHLVIPLLKWLNKLREVSRLHIFLRESLNLNNIMPTLDDEHFNKLKHIDLFYCPNVSCLVDNGTRCDGEVWNAEEKLFQELEHLKLMYLKSLGVLWKCPDEYISLTNLVTLSISRCSKLERVFTVSVAQGLVHLKEMHISWCRSLVEVIGGGGDDESGNVIIFPSLAKINFHRLSSLKSFCSGSFRIQYPSLVKVYMFKCERMDIWGSGIHETPRLKRLDGDCDVPLDGPNSINEAVAKVLWHSQSHMCKMEQEDEAKEDDNDQREDNDDDVRMELVDAINDMGTFTN
uniref:probable disease resistance protein At4g27220 n=1 Tax=Erigeron canadensis TaxID=72917 RepID=UPI001CB8D167|nr:probable disease resistance protein At4g27220 [Erigeron canadensis]